MKVLQINCVYPLGSTGKIVHDIHEYLLDKGIESVICYGRGKKVNEENVYRVSNDIYSKFQNLYSRLSGYAYGGCFLSTNYLINIIKKEKPDIVHIHCINGYFVNIYKLILWLNKNKIKTVVSNHAEFYYTANCSHSFECEKYHQGCGQCPNLKKATKSIFFDKTAKSFEKMRKAFEGFDDSIMVSTSKWGFKRAMLSPIMKDLKHEVVLNGINTDIFKYYDEKKEENAVLHVTAHFDTTMYHSKGGWAILELAKKLPSVKFYVACNNADIHHELPDNIVILGRINDQKELAKWYSRVKCSIITSERETFSMPVAESLCCGTPVVGFKAGAPELISIPEFSEFIEYGNIEVLYDIVLKWIRKSIEQELISKEAKKVYSKEMMAQTYLDIYGDLKCGRKLNN